MAILVGYIRVSGDSQKDNHSLPAQRKAIEEYCRSNGHILFNIFGEIASAEDADKREAFQFALKCVFQNLADGLVVHKLDRFCRKVLDAERLKEQFQAQSKLLLSVCDPVDLHSDDGQLMFQVKNVLQEYERKKIKERCDMGRARKRSMNGYIGGRPPYGYDAIKKTLVPNQMEQAIIKEIFRWRYERYWTLTEIAAELNSMGVTTKWGRKWGQQQVWRILSDFPEIAFQLDIVPSFISKEKMKAHKTA